MAIRKEGNRWLVDIRVAEGSTRKRIRKKFHTKPEAIRFDAFVKNQSHQGQPWNPTSSDRRTLRELVDRWYQVHGRSLKDGQRRLNKLIAQVELLGDPLASDFSPRMYVDLRARRLNGNGDEKPITENTANHELAYLKAVFNKLIELDEWRSDNPLENVKKLPFDATEMFWLTPDQIDNLLQELKASANESAYFVARVCLGTGCRWSEGEALKRQQIREGKIHFAPHKRGQARSVPFVDPEIDRYLQESKRHSSLFTPCMGAFRKAIARAGIDLPKGQLTHVCRHTFATLQMENGCSLKTLQYLLGHKTLSETIKYAHFAPSALDNVAARSPLAEK